ncbi:MAG: Uma2 family endonuclease [Chloroflexaceae bacterium]
MQTITQAHLTAAEFRQLPETEMRRELVRGEVVETMPPGGEHGAIALTLGSYLRSWAKQGPGGYVGVEAGFMLMRDPDTVRGPDVAYVRAERIPETGVPVAFWELAPDLAVEVVSPDASAADVRDKVREYLAAGTLLVWVVYPRSREIIAHTPDGMARTYAAADTLAHADLLPGFACRVAEIFE